MKRLRVLLLVLAVASVLAGVAAFALWPALARRIVDTAAGAHGLQLQYDDLELRWGRVRITNATVAMQNVSGLTARVPRVDVTLDGLTPTRVKADGAEVRVVGSAAALVIDLSRWSRDHARTLSFPLQSSNVQLAWQENERAAPWLRMIGATVDPRQGGGALVADSVRLGPVPAGAVEVEWNAGPGTVTFSVGPKGSAQRPVTLVVEHQASPPVAHATLQPVPLLALASPLGLDLGADKAASAAAKLDFELPQADGPVRGRAELTLQGYVPPHPRELDGIVFGNETKVATAFDISSDRQRVQLTDMTVQAGAFAVKGGGSVTDAGDHANIALDLQGAIACSLLAQSAVKVAVPGILGQLVGDAANRSLTGTVAVRITVQADSRNLQQAQVNPSVGIGCGLRLP